MNVTLNGHPNWQMDEQTTEKQTTDVSLYIQCKWNDKIQFLWVAKVRYDALADTCVKWKKHPQPFSSHRFIS